MNAIKIRNMEVGVGVPKICVPIVEITREQIIAEVKNLSNLPVDVVEWRVDWYEDADSVQRISETLEALRGELGDIPLLFTVRTKAEGGEKEMDVQTYAEICKAAATSGMIDLLDVQVLWAEDMALEIIKTAQANQVKVVGSNHEFYATPKCGEIVRRLKKMRQMGVDIPKIAVMPTCKKDVLVLLEATIEAETALDCPIITMSMSGLGTVSRVCGEIFGSALTFGSSKKASAPGQVGARELKELMDVMHKAYF